MSQGTEYGIMYIIRPNIDEEARVALVERFDTILKDNGVKVTESKDWGKYRLAYEVNGFRGGIYHIVNITSPSTASVVNKFNRSAKINDDITRHVIVKVEA